MRTIIELYDKEPLENVLSVCIFEPEMVVYICDARDSSLRKETAVGRLFKSRGLATQARFYYIDTSNVRAIEKTFAAVVRDYPDCVFDCSGGKDLVLLQAGIFCRERDIPAYYIDMDRQKFVCVHRCEELAKTFRMPDFTAEDIFALSGARMVGSGHFSPGLLDEEFERDSQAVWKVVWHNPGEWGKFVGYLQAVASDTPEEELEVYAPETMRVNRQTTAKCSVPILRALEKSGVVAGVRTGGGKIRFRYKNVLLKKCLQNHGIWLELYGYFLAKNSGTFTDVRTSVVVDWDNARGSQPGTRNEIDILFIKGVTPVFVSCKMGLPTPLALSEIKILSEKFGGERTRTVLLTAADVYGANRPLAQRAKDLGIVLLDRADIERDDVLMHFRRTVAK